MDLAPKNTNQGDQIAKGEKVKVVVEERCIHIKYWEPWGRDLPYIRNIAQTVSKHPQDIVLKGDLALKPQNNHE